MKHWIVLLVLMMTSCFGQGHVLVSIAPHQLFVEKIANKLITTQIMVPAGASAHTFEPTPKQVLAAAKADLWFQMGEAFEAQAAAALTSHNPQLTLIDLRVGLEMIGYSHCCSNGQDVHTWLSPKMAKKQAENIAQVLSQKYPEHKSSFQTNLEAFLEELDSLDQEIHASIQPLKQRTLLISHPAYAYFCRDYNLTQLPIEQEGKDPSPKYLTTLLNQARRLEIKFVYVQEQHSTKGAKLIANELNATVISLDPYEKNYLENMRFIAKQFARQG